MNKPTGLKIIALTGVKTSGKTTVFNILKELIPEVQEIQLARKLKDVCAKHLGVDREAFDDPERKEALLQRPRFLTHTSVRHIIKEYSNHRDDDRLVLPHVGVQLTTPRKVAQYIGTEVLRAIHPDIHCIEATKDLPTEGVFVVSDMRFLNEFDFFKRNFSEAFFPFFIQNEVAELAGSSDLHPSEREVFAVGVRCTVLHNNGSLRELRGRVITVAQSISEFVLY